MLTSILSTDGGGVKGYSSLLILKQLMEEMKRIEAGETQMIDKIDPVGSSFSCPWTNCVQDPSDTEFFLHHYVDYFFGTSTGG
jgi:patatin-like phospholipase/acyl hydrolase